MNTTFWDVTPCLHAYLKIPPWEWRQNVPLTHQRTSAILHGCTYQKVVHLIFTAVWTPSLTELKLFLCDLDEFKLLQHINLVICFRPFCHLWVKNEYEAEIAVSALQGIRMAGNKLLVARAEKLLNTFKLPVDVWSCKRIADVDAGTLQNFAVRCLMCVIRVYR